MQEDSLVEPIRHTRFGRIRGSLGCLDMFKHPCGRHKDV